MQDNKKSTDAYMSIGEIAKKLNLINKKTGALQTHTIRYWETQFKQINPSILAGNRRYYSPKNLKTIRLIKSLLKDRGMTIKGVKRIFDNPKFHSLDDNIDKGIYKRNYKDTEKIKKQINNIKKIAKELNKFK